ncbi:MAG: gliding motility-associated C-terminal domain-containing protein [Bacteroidales bacterium]|nr:gliding motility-associated C-terminal domain-containing protein [Bacteroidales bacterium]
MKYRLFSRIGLMVTFLFVCFFSARLSAQEGVYTVRIKQPAVDTVKTCQNKTVIFMAEGQNADFSPFEPGNVENSTDGVVGQTVSHAFARGGHYLVKLIVKGKSGRPDATNVPELHVYVSMSPSFTGTRSDHSSICSGNEIGLSGFVTSIPWTADEYPFENTYAQSDYYWNGVGIQSDRNGIARVKPPLNKGNLEYIFRVTDDFECYHDTTLILYGVSADFSPTPTSGEAPLEITLNIDNSSNGGDESAIDYKYEFYETHGDSSNLLTTTESKFTLERPGQYLARVIATYEQCSFVYTFENYIKVDSSLLEIPNVFTPNGDGANDFFQVKALSLKTFSGKIMNRYGRVVYEWTNSKDFEQGWNGNYMGTGKPVPAGTYYYIISAVGYDDKVYKGKANEKVYYGFLTLFR